MRISRLVHLCVIVTLAATAVRAAQAPEQPEDPTPITATDVQSRIALIEQDQALEVALKEAALALLADATRELARADEFRATAAEFRRQAAAAPETLGAIRSELSQPAPEVVVAPDKETPLARLEQLQSEAAAELSSAREQLALLQSEVTRRQERRTQLSGLLTSKRQALSEFDLAEQGGTPDEPVAIADQRRILRSARRATLVAEIDSLEAESASYDARQELLPARRDRAERRVAQAEKAVAAWQPVVSERRQIEAQAAVEAAKALAREAARQHPVLQEFATRSETLAQQRTEADGIPARISATGEKVAGSRARLTQLQNDYRSVKRRLETSGLNRATGLILRRQFDALPNLTELRSQVRTTQRELEDAEFTLVERQDDRAGAGDIDAIVTELLAEIEATGFASDRGELTVVATELVTARRNLLDQLISDSTTYFEKLVVLSDVTRDLFSASDEYRDLVSERILWVRSIADRSPPSVTDFGEAIWRFIDPDMWRSCWQRTWMGIRSRWVVVSLSFISLMVVFAAGRRTRPQIQSLTERVESYKTDAFSHTAWVAAYALLAAIPLPGLLWWIGWVLATPSGQEPVALALGAALQEVSLSLLVVLIVREVLRPNGLAEVHFRWPGPALAKVRRRLGVFIVIVLPAMLVLIATDQLGDEASSRTLGRLASSLALVAFVWLIHGVTRSSGMVWKEIVRRNPTSLITRLRVVWHPLLYIVPLGLIILAWGGYFYTAVQLQSAMEDTIGLVLLLVLIQALLHRWLFITRRRVALEDARRRREASTLGTDAAGVSDDAPTESGMTVDEEEKLDLPAISQQSRQLFRALTALTLIVGLLAIWADVLPALRALDRLQLWPEVTLVDSEGSFVIPLLEPTGGALTADPVSLQNANNGNSSAAPAVQRPSADLTNPAMLTQSGSPVEREASATTEIATSITAADLGLAIVILLATVIVFKNLPGLIEIIVIQRLPLDSGSRYALTTVIRYGIAIIGILIASNAAGFSWSKIQWLAAALTFGLAFGLQEIFANFMSGLILLAERPIRIGDTVTVGNVTGTVTRIRMRATMITDWDRKELVIPNKSFVTGEIINWTLSDPVLRVTIPVGVSYGADVRLAEKTLLEVANKSGIVLADPKPYVVFSRFGDSTLDFELRVYIPHIDHWVTVRHELHMAITTAFRKKGIEIAFPQRDLHVRSIGDLKSLLQKREDLPGDEPAGL